MIFVFTQAQELDYCVFDENELPEPSELYTPFTDVPSPSLEPIVFNLFFWKVNDSEGNYNNTNFTDQKILEGVVHLNITYNRFNIFFKYLGNDSFNSPVYVPLIAPEVICNGNPGCSTEPDCFNEPGCYNNVCVDQQVNDPTGYGMIRICQRGIFFNYVLTNGYKKPNAINIYAPYATEGYRGAASYSNTSVIVKPQDFASHVMPHEIAHIFALQRTRSLTENVPRNQEHPHFNADSTADWVVQTAAINHFRDPVTGTFPFVNLQTCIYNNDGSQQDSHGNAYDASFQDVGNIMGDCTPCMEQYPHFFPEQGNKMRNQILSFPTLFEPKQNTIASLYEPYKGEYYFAEPQTNESPLFQPGFRYKFRECQCDCPEPSPYEDTSFTIGSTTVLTIEPNETNFNSITHPNHTAIQIMFQTSLPEAYGQNTRKCYDNWNRAPIGGSVTKFNDGIFNANVTITPQDSTSINNPNLLLQLDQGLYKIEKNYEDGAVNQQVIYKDNE
ncbi:MAG: hypothetical protein CVU03_06145 [Bacteroidetes bacterium HGW-Bacteroidetes-2]|jgi:hypothetical protein|nr:MAG: hypothetical protein CVU03_06145 [Bacteroidetes bacterium HGW-Bacteroidetes-2]